MSDKSCYVRHWVRKVQAEEGDLIEYDVDALIFSVSDLNQLTKFDPNNRDWTSEHLAEISKLKCVPRIETMTSEVESKKVLSKGRGSTMKKRLDRGHSENYITRQIEKTLNLGSDDHVHSTGFNPHMSRHRSGFMKGVFHCSQNKTRPHGRGRGITSRNDENQFANNFHSFLPCTSSESFVTCESQDNC